MRGTLNYKERRSWSGEREEGDGGALGGKSIKEIRLVYQKEKKETDKYVVEITRDA